MLVPNGNGGITDYYTLYAITLKNSVDALISATFVVTVRGILPALLTCNIGFVFETYLAKSFKYITKTCSLLFVLHKSALQTFQMAEKKTFQ